MKRFVLPSALLLGVVAINAYAQTSKTGSTRAAAQYVSQNLGDKPSDFRENNIH